MKLGPYGKFFVEYVMAFVNDNLARWEFDLDYSGNVLEHFPEFESETPKLAAKFARTVDRACESCAWMDDMALADALSDTLDGFFEAQNLPDFY